MGKVAITVPMKSLALALSVLLVGCTAPAVTAPVTQTQDYELRTASADGTGKFYQGREIAQVMGHEGAFWLERPSRELTERPQQVIEQMQLKPTDVVADIGAGTGYFSFRLATAVPQGKVLAVDIQPEMLTIIEGLKKDRKVTNIQPILGTITDPKLPANSVDVVLLVDAYHEFSHPREMQAGIVRALRPGGRVVQIEYRGEDPLVPIKGLHKMTQAQARKEWQAAGLVWKESRDFLPQQHFMVFEKSKPTP